MKTEQTKFQSGDKVKVNFGSFKLGELSKREVSKVITAIEDNGELPVKFTEGKVPVLGITGTGGAGKSSLIDELLLRFYRHSPNCKIALISVDPTKRKHQERFLETVSV
jgi:methylmalonyl-CoA mutase